MKIGTSGLEDQEHAIQARGDVVIFDENMGNAAFVSHQWVSRSHPDPNFEQMQVLKDAISHLLYREGYISVNWVTEFLVPGAKRISYKEFQARPLFIWYDYFSVQQDAGYDNQLAEAISSIPAYVAKCRFFFALCPTIGCPAHARVLTTASWNARGWCRLPGKGEGHPSERPLL